MTEEFNIYIKKMHELLENSKIAHLLKRRDSKGLKEKMEITIFEKREKVEKIKTLIKEKNTTTNVKSETTNLLQDFQKNENNNKDKEIISKDIASQEESFKKRLEAKKLTRNNSQPRMNFKVRLLIYLNNFIKSNFKLRAVNENIQKKEDLIEENKSIVNNNNQDSIISNYLFIFYKKLKYLLKNVNIFLVNAKGKRGSVQKSQSPVRRSSRLSVHEEEVNEKGKLKKFFFFFN